MGRIIHILPRGFPLLRCRMRERVFLLIHLFATIAELLLPGGTRSIIAESLLLKHQLLILNRSRARAPNLRPVDRIIASLCAGLIRPARLLRSAIVLKPSTLMTFHRGLGESQISLALRTEAAREARTERAQSRTDSSDRRNETAESSLRLPAHRSTDRSLIWCRDRQGCCATCTRETLSADRRFRRSVLAHVPRTRQGQPLECRSLSL